MAPLAKIIHPKILPFIVHFTIIAFTDCIKKEKTNSINRKCTHIKNRRAESSVWFIFLLLIFPIEPSLIPFHRCHFQNSSSVLHVKSLLYLHLFLFQFYDRYFHHEASVLHLNAELMIEFHLLCTNHQKIDNILQDPLRKE